MPTILLINGWRFFFYSDERKEPMHVHCKKAEKICKFWLDEKNFDIDEAFTANMNATDINFVRRSIFAHFDYIAAQWKKFHGGK